MPQTFVPSLRHNGSHDAAASRVSSFGPAAREVGTASAATPATAVAVATTPAAPAPALAPVAPAPDPALPAPAPAASARAPGRAAAQPPPLAAEVAGPVFPSPNSLSLARWAAASEHVAPLRAALESADHEIVRLFGLMRTHFNPPVAEGEEVDAEARAARLEEKFAEFVADQPPFVLNQTEAQARAAFEFIVRQAPFAPEAEEAHQDQADRLQAAVTEACGVAISHEAATTTLLDLDRVRDSLQPAFEHGDPVALNAGLRDLVDAVFHNACNPNWPRNPQDAQQVDTMFMFLGVAMATGGERYLAELRECLALQALLIGYLRVG